MLTYGGNGIPDLYERLSSQITAHRNWQMAKNEVLKTRPSPDMLIPYLDHRTKVALSRDK